MTLRERVLKLIQGEGALTDRQITDRLFGTSAAPQAVNQECRRLQAAGLLTRHQHADGRIRNHPVSEPLPMPSPQPKSVQRGIDGLSEDALKTALIHWLEADGWHIEFHAMGRLKGIDIDARKGPERWIIEVKGIGSLPAMRVNYFLAVLGETLQRMNDPAARYSIALPDVPQFIGLWERLPELAKTRTGISVLFVNHEGSVREQ